MATAQDVQTAHLAMLQASKKPVFVFLINGIKLVGLLHSHDTYVMSISSPAGMQTVYKSAICSVVEAHTVQRTPVTQREQRESVVRMPRRRKTT
jgi:host factor-I protein